MKITDKDYSELKKLVSWLTPEQIRGIREGHEKMEHPETQYLWNVYHLTSTRWYNNGQREFFSGLNLYLNDSNIFTAMRRILRELLEE